jgi:hypothetical protein
MRSELLRQHPVQADTPKDIQRLLFEAIDYFCLAYEQVNHAGRGHLYERLTNDAFIKAALAPEMTLERRLGRGKRVKLEELISDGITKGLLPSTNGYDLILEQLRHNRNAIVHDDPDRSSYGPGTARFIRVVIDALNAMYANDIVKSEGDT